MFILQQYFDQANKMEAEKSQREQILLVSQNTPGSHTHKHINYQLNVETDIHIFPTKMFTSEDYEIHWSFSQNTFQTKLSVENIRG